MFPNAFPPDTKYELPQARKLLQVEDKEKYFIRFLSHFASLSNVPFFECIGKSLEEGFYK